MSAKILFILFSAFFILYLTEEGFFLEFNSTIIHIFLEGLLYKLFSQNMNYVIQQIFICVVTLKKI